MAAYLVGYGYPFTSINFSEDIEGGQSGSKADLWRSDAADIDTRLTEVMAAALPLGTIFSTAPFTKTIITNRAVAMVSDSDDLHFVVTYTFGPRKRRVITSSADWRFSFSSSVGGAQTNVDADGNFITVGTITNSADPLPTTGPPYTTVPKTGAQVEKLFPSITITAGGIVTSNPFASYKAKVGTLNSVAMTVDGQTLAIGTTMLTSASVSTPNDGDSYNVDYSFEYREDPLDWFAVVVAIDPKTGKPYAGISGTFYNTAAGDTKGTISVVAGSIGYEMYPQTDIGALIS